MSKEQEQLVRRFMTCLALRNGHAARRALDRLAIELGLTEEDSAWVLEEDGLLYEKSNYRLAKVIAARLLRTWED